MPTELERAVIEAARELRRLLTPKIWLDSMDPGEVELAALAAAVDALDAAGKPGEREIEWFLVAEGDQLRSPANGQFYPVTATRKMQGGTVQVTVSLGTASKTITRPTEKEPLAYIRRGPAGRAVDAVVCVLSSGGE